jgi:hypothetical protein
LKKEHETLEVTQRTNELQFRDDVELMRSHMNERMMTLFNGLDQKLGQLRDGKVESELIQMRKDFEK